MGRQVRRRSTGEVGTAYAPFRDAHVHLGLIDPAGLPGGGIGAVVDLGWSPEIAALAAPVPVTYAGCFLSAPDGYPSDRSWAPRASTAFVASPAEAGPAVRQQLDLGAGVIKVTLNRDAGPVLDLATLVAIVSAADRVPVVAHAQGPGMVELALAGGVAVLAHSPWTHRLDDEVIAEVVAAGQRWISTLDIHGYGASTPDRARAGDNLARFHAAGGTVVYGTDLGNGPLPVGLNLREIEGLREAGLTDADIIDALTSTWPVPLPTDRATFVPAGSVGALDGATVVPTNDLEELS
jgi:imidazolonepropionase-like amidohydrolase